MLIAGVEPVEPVLRLHHLTDHNMLLSDETNRQTKVEFALSKLLK